EIEIRDEGGDADKVRKLRDILEQDCESGRIKDKCGGLDIVRLLADSVNFIQSDDNVTKVSVVRYKEDNESSNRRSI
ncbi:MAG: hypothetical protein ACLFQK_11655, partial [Fibrobacterota bacterium]